MPVVHEKRYPASVRSPDAGISPVCYLVRCPNLELEGLFPNSWRASRMSHDISHTDVIRMNFPLPQPLVCL